MLEMKNKKKYLLKRSIAFLLALVLLVSTLGFNPIQKNPHVKAAGHVHTEDCYEGHNHEICGCEIGLPITITCDYTDKTPDGWLPARYRAGFYIKTKYQKIRVNISGTHGESSDDYVDIQQSFTPYNSSRYDVSDEFKNIAKAVYEYKLTNSIDSNTDISGLFDFSGVLSRIFWDGKWGGTIGKYYIKPGDTWQLCGSDCKSYSCGLSVSELDSVAIRSFAENYSFSYSGIQHSGGSDYVSIKCPTCSQDLIKVSRDYRNSDDVNYSYSTSICYGLTIDGQSLYYYPNNSSDVTNMQKSYIQTLYHELRSVCGNYINIDPEKQSNGDGTWSGYANITVSTSQVLSDICNNLSLSQYVTNNIDKQKMTILCNRCKENNNGINVVNTPSCDKVVTSLVPINSNQTIPFGGTPNLTATATFLDGHTQVVTCNSTPFIQNQLGLQNLTLSYGEYSDTAKNKSPKSVNIQVNVLGGPKTITLNKKVQYLKEGDKLDLSCKSSYYDGTSPDLTELNGVAYNGSVQQGTLTSDFDGLEGNKTVTVTHTFKGTSATDTINVYADYTSPVINSITGVKWDKEKNVIKVSATDNLTGIDGYIITSDNVKPTLDNPKWQTSDTFNCNSIGDYYVWVKDKTGNISNSTKVTILIDNNVPTISYVTNLTAENEWVDSTTGTKLRIVANDEIKDNSLASGVEQYKVEFKSEDSNTYTTLQDWTINPSDSNSLDIMCTVHKRGTYKFSVQDKAGNQAIAQEIVVTNIRDIVDFSAEYTGDKVLETGKAGINYSSYTKVNPNKVAVTLNYDNGDTVSYSSLSEINNDIADIQYKILPYTIRKGNNAIQLNLKSKFTQLAGSDGILRNFNVMGKSKSLVDVKSVYNGNDLNEDGQLYSDSDIKISDFTVDAIYDNGDTDTTSNGKINDTVCVSINVESIIDEANNEDEDESDNMKSKVTLTFTNPHNTDKVDKLSNEHIFNMTPFKFTKNEDDTYTLTSFSDSCDIDVLKIPETFNGQPVVAINPTAVEVVSITPLLDDRIAQVLEYGELDSNVTNMVTYQNKNYRALDENVEKGVFQDTKKVKSIVVPSTVRYIGKSTFKDTKMQEISIGKNVSYLADEAIKNCDQLDKVLIWNKNLTLDNNSIEDASDFTIYGYRESTARDYAHVNNIKFKALDAIQEIKASYSTDTVSTGEELNTDNIMVTARTYKNGTLEFEEKQLDPNIPWLITQEEVATATGGAIYLSHDFDSDNTKPGPREVNVSYKDNSLETVANDTGVLTTSFDINVRVRKITSITAEYTGTVLDKDGNTVVGQYDSYEVDKDKVKLIATFNDGSSQVITGKNLDNMKLTNTKIENVGENANVVNVEYTYTYYLDNEDTKTTTCTTEMLVTGVPRTLSETDNNLIVSYRGEDTVSKPQLEYSDFDIIAAYSDGKISQVTKDFTIFNKTNNSDCGILEYGLNEVVIIYRDKQYNETFSIFRKPQAPEITVNVDLANNKDVTEHKPIIPSGENASGSAIVVVEDNENVSNNDTINEQPVISSLSIAGNDISNDLLTDTQDSDTQDSNTQVSNTDIQDTQDDNTDDTDDKSVVNDSNSDGNSDDTSSQSSSEAIDSNTKNTIMNASEDNNNEGSEDGIAEALVISLNQADYLNTTMYYKVSYTIDGVNYNTVVDWTLYEDIAYVKNIAVGIYKIEAKAVVTSDPSNESDIATRTRVYTMNNANDSVLFNIYDGPILVTPEHVIQTTENGVQIYNNTNNFEIIGGNEFTTNNIVIEGTLGELTLTLNNVKIDTRATGEAALDIQSGIVTINIKGDTRLISGGTHAGLEVDYGSTVIINCPDDATLFAQGSTGGAGIGSAAGLPCGDITINGGNITAIGDSEGAGIGGSKANIVINDATINTTGGNGIYGDNILIQDSDVTATGTNHDGIHGDQNVIINNSKVVATGKENGIYAGYDVIIENSDIKAKGNISDINAGHDVRKDEGTTIDGVISDTIGSLTRDKEKLLDEIVKLKEENKDLKEKLNELKLEVEKLKEENEKLLMQNATLKTENEALKAKIQALEQSEEKVQVLEAKVKEKDSLVEHLTQKVNELNEKVQAMKAKQLQVEKELANAKKLNADNKSNDSSDKVVINYTTKNSAIEKSTQKYTVAASGWELSTSLDKDADWSDSLDYSATQQVGVYSYLTKQTSKSSKTTKKVYYARRKDNPNEVYVYTTNATSNEYVSPITTIKCSNPKIVKCFDVGNTYDIAVDGTLTFDVSADYGPYGMDSVYYQLVDSEQDLNHNANWIKVNNNQIKVDVQKAARLYVKFVDKNGNYTIDKTVGFRASNYVVNNNFANTVADNQTNSVANYEDVINEYVIQSGKQVQVKNDIKDAMISYVSEDEKIATVNQDGMITAVSEGQTVIWKKVNDGTKQYAIKNIVTVYTGATDEIEQNTDTENVGNLTISINDDADNKSISKTERIIQQVTSFTQDNWPYMVAGLFSVVVLILFIYGKVKGRYNNVQKARYADEE